MTPSLAQRRTRCAAALSAAVACLCAAGFVSADTIRIGGKSFTEQFVMGEIAAQLIERHTDLNVVRRLGLGGTGVCHAALVSGEIDLYIEYTGTALVDILREAPQSNASAVYRTIARAYREQFDLVVLPPIGFNDTYTLAVRAADAEKHQWTRISDLAGHAERLTAGFPSEFVERPDGYPGLRRIYGLSFAAIREVDPGLMYDALAGGQVDLICGFSTDSRLTEHDFRLLEDDRGYFPPYFAVPIVRGETLRRRPELADALASITGSIDNDAMRRLNREVDILHRLPANVARDWIERHDGDGDASAATSTGPTAARSRGLFELFYLRRAELGRKTTEHLLLTGLAMAFAVALGLPLGILIHRIPRIASGVLAMTEVVQTVPSLAMLAFLFAVYGALGTAPAVTALVLYALLPIVLNTYTGLKHVPADAREAADGIGMSAHQKLWLVELPLALPVIVAGVRTSTVWTVGIATLSTYIGAGGLGDFISRGLSRNDATLTLLGAVPAGLMAIVLSVLIRLIEGRLRGRVGAAA